MDWLRWAVYGLYAVLAVLAVLVARREPAHRAFAAFVVWMTTTDWVRLLLAMLRKGAENPYTGAARLNHHIDQGLVFGWSFGMLALTLHSFTRIRPWYALVGWAIAIAVCLDYPTVRGPLYQTVYLVAALSCLGLCLAAVAWALMVRHDLTPKLHHLGIMAFLAADAVAYLLPYVKNVFEDWPVVRAINVVLLTSLCLLHAQELLRPRRRPPRKLPR